MYNEYMDRSEGLETVDVDGRNNYIFRKRNV